MGKDAKRSVDPIGSRLGLFQKPEAAKNQTMRIFVMNEDLQKLKLERDTYKHRYEELKIEAELAAIIETLPSRYDRNRVKGLVDDSLEVFTLDSRENIVTRSGKSAKDWIQAKADLYNFTMAPASRKQQDEKRDYRFTGGVNLIDPDLRGKLT